MDKRISVTGTGRIKAAVDQVEITMELSAENKDYDKAMALSTKKIDEITSALQSVGFDKKELKTTDFNVSTVFKDVKDKNDRYSSVFDRYSVTHGLKLEFDFSSELLSDVLNALSNCSAKPEFNVNFTVKDKQAVYENLLQTTVENALKTATTLTAAAGVKLGALVNIDYSCERPELYSRTRVGTMTHGTVPRIANYAIEPEDIDISDNVTIVWEIL